MVGSPHRAAAGDRCLHRRASRGGVPLRQAVRRPEEGARRGSVHRGEPVTAPPPGGQRARRVDRSGRRPGARVRNSGRLRRDGPWTSGDDRRPAGAQGRQDHVLLRRPVAGTADLRAGPVRRRRRRTGAPSGDSRRTGVRHGGQAGTRPRCAGGRRGRLRRAGRVRVQLRAARHRVQQARRAAGAQGPA